MERIAEKAVEAVGYMRTSSATNVGADKDSEKRQRAAIEGYAKRAKMSVTDWFYDPAVSGADPIESRPGFARLLDRIEGNGVRVVLIEDASRFARDLIAQELGIVLLVARGVKVITAAGDDLTDTSDPSRVMMRQIAGAFAQYEKARLVARLRRAREVKGKMGGRKSHAELRPNVVALAKQLRKRQKSLREISRELAARGYLSKSGKPFTARSVSNMLEAS
jgi:DNA invertase Pin-like site-specific DNA recombinase